MNKIHDNKYFVPAGMQQPDSTAIEHSNKLSALIKQEISDNNGIPFSHFMQMALYQPGLGYYSAGSHKLGAGGDFTTAPEISSLFSICLARQCAQVLEHLDHKRILEFGAGSGIMAADILLELEKSNCLPTEYLIIELSAELKQRQQQTIQLKAPHLLDRVTWNNNLPAQPFEGIILANELIDAMPVEKFRITQDGPRDIIVALNNETLALTTSTSCSEQVLTRLQAMHSDLPLGYESEINLAMESWLTSVASLLERGMILINDYGYPQHEYYHGERNSGTLMCFYQHKCHTNPLVLLGLQDITAHVDFTALANCAGTNGLHVAGYTTQAFFLLACGLESIKSGLCNNIHDEVRINTQIKKLTLPTEMGERFKAMAMTKNLDMALAGFTLNDQRARLLPMT